MYTLNIGFLKTVFNLIIVLNVLESCVDLVVYFCCGLFRKLKLFSQAEAIATGSQPHTAGTLPLCLKGLKLRYSSW